MKNLDAMTIGFIGGGNMAEAIINGLLDGGVTAADRILISDPSSERRDLFSNDRAIRTTTDNARVVGTADIVILAVKPQLMGEVLEPLARDFRKDQLVISIAAGIRSSRINAMCNDTPIVVRVMPNTPALVGCGVSAITRGARAEDEHVEIAVKLFSAVGKAIVVNEHQMDAITAVSGSGPAYVFYWMEAMLQAAADAGLDDTVARELVYETFKGAAKLADASDVSAGVLRERVTSKGGTTEAALKVMEENGVSQAIRDAVAAAAARSMELSDT